MRLSFGHGALCTPARRISNRSKQRFYLIEYTEEDLGEELEHCTARAGRRMHVPGRTASALLVPTAQSWLQLRSAIARPWRWPRLPAWTLPPCPVSSCHAEAALPASPPPKPARPAWHGDARPFFMTCFMPQPKRSARESAKCSTTGASTVSEATCTLRGGPERQGCQGAQVCFTPQATKHHGKGFAHAPRLRNTRRFLTACVNICIGCKSSCRCEVNDFTVGDCTFYNPTLQNNQGLLYAAVLVQRSMHRWRLRSTSSVNHRL